MPVFAWYWGRVLVPCALFSRPCCPEIGRECSNATRFSDFRASDARVCDGRWLDHRRSEATTSRAARGPRSASLLSHSHRLFARAGLKPMRRLDSSPEIAEVSREPGGYTGSDLPHRDLTGQKL